MYVVTLPAKYDFEEVSLAIMAEEATCHQFKGNEVKSDAQVEYNETSFDYYADGAPHPHDCIVLAAENAVPAGHIEEWRGQMLVQNKKRHVVLYRAA